MLCAWNWEAKLPPTWSQELSQRQSELRLKLRLQQTERDCDPFHLPPGSASWFDS